MFSRQPPHSSVGSRELVRCGYWVSELVLILTRTSPSVHPHSSMYALMILGSHGLQPQILYKVAKMTTIASLMYALTA